MLKKNSMLGKIATDVHFWIPLIVLALGTTILLALR